MSCLLFVIIHNLYICRFTLFASSLLRVGKQCYCFRTRPEGRATLESDPSAVARACGWAGLNVLPLSELVIHWPQCDKLQGVWGTGPPG